MRKTVKMMMAVSLLALFVACGNTEVKEEVKAEKVIVAEEITVTEVSEEAVVADQKLEESYWTLETLGGEAINLTKTPYILLNTINGVVNGYTGGNSLSALYTLKEMSLMFDNIRITRRYVEEAKDVEPNFIKALEATVTYSVKGDKLTLLDENGQELATFKTEIKEETTI